jgi:hypothetical protein
VLKAAVMLVEAFIVMSILPHLNPISQWEGTSTLLDEWTVELRIAHQELSDYKAEFEADKLKRQRNIPPSFCLRHCKS